MTEGLSSVLDEIQLEELDCAALELSTAITAFLARASYFLENPQGVSFTSSNVRDVRHELGFNYDNCQTILL